METQLVPLLRTRACDRRETLPVRTRIEAHLRETEEQIERVRLALQAIRSAPSSSPNGLAVGVGVPLLPAAFFSGRGVRKAISDFAAKQAEIAVYTALIEAAEHAGEKEVARLCRLNRGEDEEMAEWLEAHLALLAAETFDITKERT